MTQKVTHLSRLITFRLFFLLLLASITSLPGCVKQSQDSGAKHLNFADSAKHWFESNIKTLELSGALHWNMAKVVVTGNDKRYVEVPVILKQPLQGRIRQNGKFRLIEMGSNLKSYVKLLIYLDEARQFNCKMMKVIDDTKYESLAEIVSIGYLPPNFSGFIYYTTLTGRIMQGYGYREGKITSRMSRARASGSNNRIDCTTVTIDYYQQVCIDDNCSEWKYLYSSSTTTCQYTQEDAADQPYDPDGPGDTGGVGSGEIYNWEEIQQTYNQVEVDTVINQVENPCIDAIIAQVTDEKLRNYIAKLFEKTFVATGTRVKLKLIDQQTVLDNDGNSIAAQSWYIPGANEWGVRISRDWAAYSSKEWMGMAILHELVHSYLNFYRAQGVPVLSEFSSHETIFKEWVNELRDALIEIYGMSQADATALGLQGIEDVVLKNIDANSRPVWQAQYDILAQQNYGTTLQNAHNIATGYATGTTGTHCQ